MKIKLLVICVSAKGMTEKSNTDNSQGLVKPHGLTKRADTPILSADAFRVATGWRYNLFMRKFHLVDFAAHYQKGFRNHVVSIAEVPGLMEFFRHYGCYTTYFFYSDEVLTYMSSRLGGTAPTIAGYEGKVWAPFFPIDLDHPDLIPALKAVRLLTSILVELWKIDPKGLQVYFSGSKGFHLLLDVRLFGKVMPSKALPLIFDSMRRHFAHELPEDLRETVDLGIKDRVRLLRLPNTIHEKSNLYKILLNLDEVRKASAEEIRACARGPRLLSMTDETGFLSRVEVEKSEKASELLQRVKSQVNKFARKPFRYRFRRPFDPEHITFLCAALQRIWDSHIEPGYRNNCAIRLASALRRFGLNEEETDEKLERWNEIRNIRLPRDELHNVVRSAYQHRFPYRYGCRDVILRHFCPLPEYELCRSFVASQRGAECSA
jgi:hypothetical protein